MSSSVQKKQILISLLTLASLVLLIAIFYLPTWWVSLTAPNYPEEAFPGRCTDSFPYEWGF